MKCEECLRLIDLHFDGELDGRESADVMAHLGVCAACARLYRNLREEQSLYLRYGCDSTESPSFWDEVMSRVEADKTAAPDTLAARLRRLFAGARPTLAAPRFSPLVTAAMLLAAVVLTAALMLYVRPRDGGPGASATVEHKGGGTVTPQPPARGEVAQEVSSEAPAGGEAGEGSAHLNAEANPGAAEEIHGARGGGRLGAKPAVVKPAAVKLAKGDAPVLSHGAAAPAPERLIQEAERKYLSAIAALSHDVGRRRRQMDAETIDSFERTLAVVDRAIAETRAAARRHPRDPVVVQYMMAAYAKKVDLLRGMAQD
ncbi:MAG TPA: zf-HC2 domain-containing protein [Pyrinomonadaceae bacterium]|nr:zf-HC2 domain-containing protein [Pyrinomonadaceae bacterium]